MASAFTASSVLKEAQCNICSLDETKRGKDDRSGRWLEDVSWARVWGLFGCPQKAVLGSLTAEEQEASQHSPALLAISGELS